MLTMASPCPKGIYSSPCAFSSSVAVLQYAHALKAGQSIPLALLVLGRIVHLWILCQQVIACPLFREVVALCLILRCRCVWLHAVHVQMRHAEPAFPGIGNGSRSDSSPETRRIPSLPSSKEDTWIQPSYPHRYIITSSDRCLFMKPLQGIVT